MVVWWLELDVEAAARATDDRARFRGVRQQYNRNMRSGAKSNKLPSYNEKSDQMDSHIQRFERYARASQWKELGGFCNHPRGLIDRHGTSSIFSSIRRGGYKLCRAEKHFIKAV